ncbi:MAG: ATP-binding protein [Maribacter sp.]
MNEEKIFITIADQLPIMAFFSNQYAEVSYCSKNWLEFVGLGSHEVLGKAWVKLIHPEDLQELLEVYMISVDNRRSYSFECRVKRYDGQFRYLLFKGVPKYCDSGEYTGHIGSAVDIHDSKMVDRNFKEQLEQKVQERTEELRRSNVSLKEANEELTSFAYMASHDLQEPLRKIQTFCSIVQASGENLSERQKSALVKINDSAGRLRQLVTDLLAFSRTENMKESFEEVDIVALIKEVLFDLDDDIKSKNAEIRFEGGCRATVIPFYLKQLANNLISNSLKFTAAGRRPLLTITIEKACIKNAKYHCKEGEECLCLIFTDNGIGFKPEFGNRIFGIFQRLNDRSKFKGTGVGLAIVKKIVGVHEGKIFALGKEGCGAQFEIYIPQ